MKKSTNILYFVLLASIIIFLSLSSKNVLAEKKLCEDKICIRIVNNEKGIVSHSNLSGIEVKIFKSELVNYNETNGERIFNEKLCETLYTDYKGRIYIDNDFDYYTLSVNIETLPRGYGINEYEKFYYVEEEKPIFKISKIDGVRFDSKNQIEIFNKNNEKIYAYYTERIEIKENETVDMTSERLREMTGFSKKTIIDIYGKEYTISTNIDLSFSNYFEKVNYLFSENIIDVDKMLELYNDYFINNGELSDYISTNTNSIQVENSYTTESDNFIFYYDSTVLSSVVTYVLNIFEDVGYHFISYNSFLEPQSRDSSKYKIVIQRNLHSNNTKVSGVCYPDGEYSYIAIDYDIAYSGFNYGGDKDLYVKDTCAHEFFHAITLRYYSANDTNYLWFIESLGAWAGINYTNKSLEFNKTSADLLLENPEKSLNDEATGNYSKFLLFLYIEQEMGGTPAIKSILNKTSVFPNDPFKAINSGLNNYNSLYTLAKAFEGMVKFNTIPKEYYDVLNNETNNVWQKAKTINIDPSDPSEITKNAKNMSAQYFKFSQSNSIDNKQYVLSITIESSDYSWLRAGVISTSSNESYINNSSIVLNTNRVRYEKLSYNSQTFSNIYLYIANTNTNVNSASVEEQSEISYSVSYKIDEIFSPNNIYLISNVHSGKYVTVAGGINSEGNNVCQYQNIGAPRHRFLLERVMIGSSEYYRIVETMSQERMLTIKYNNGILSDGNNVVINSSVNYANQLWSFIHLGDGKFKIQNAYQNLCLTVCGTENGSVEGCTSTSTGNIYVKSFVDANTQKWLFHKITS